MTIDEFMSRVSDVMILKMKELNLSNADIARALNVNKSTVGDWVNKTTLIKSNMIKPLCDVLQITPNYLYNVSSDEDITEALKIYNAYNNHPAVQDAVDKLLDIKKA